jgi:hypothetical protein
MRLKEMAAGVNRRVGNQWVFKIYQRDQFFI